MPTVSLSSLLLSIPPVGPGLYCYAICCASAIVRAIVHWLTPLPGQGAPSISQCCDSQRWRALEAAAVFNTEDASGIAA